MQSRIIEETAVFLLKEGFTVKNLNRKCFDILARKYSQILLIKVLSDANAVTQEYSNEMKKLASFIGATPLIIAEKAGEKIVDNVVYSRLGIYTLNQATLRNALRNKLPFVRRNKAGLTADIDGEILRKIREEQDISLGEMSSKIGVSRKMIQRYENGCEITLAKAMKMYDLFGHKIFNKINLFSGVNDFEVASSDITVKYNELGFDATETRKAPFDVIAKKEKEIILTELGDKTKPEFSSLSRLLDADNLVIFEKKKPKDIPSMKREEFLDFEKAEELIKFLKEF